MSFVVRTLPANGHTAFIPNIRKLVFDLCESWPSSTNTRTFVQNHIRTLAAENPHVEIVVRQCSKKEPVVRGFYGMSRVLCTDAAHSAVNNRDKVISLKELEVTGIQKKVQLLLDSSGAKIKPLKRRTVESTTESTRGIWSGLHAERPTL